ncbi:potassium channel family protein, partial [Armatimonas sp.]|uniref:potassium channel family protein n=1 Tax=Armatimonas sp. TaxID=1872638 RepID=UPI00286AEC1D
MRIALALLCLTVIGSVLLEAFEGLVLPRRISRPLRAVRYFYVSLWMSWRSIGRRLRPGIRDDWFAVYGPFSVLALFIGWGILLVLAFAGLGWSLKLSISAPEGAPTFATYLYLSATTFITLGFGDVAPRTNLARAITDCEAALGFGFLAIVIAYLPVLYQAFAKREVEIGMLDARASTPPSAGELLKRIGGCPDLGDLKDT